MTILREPKAPEGFRVVVTSLGAPYVAAFTGYHARPGSACDAALEFKITPPIWIACMVQGSTNRNYFQRDRVREAFELFAERLTDTQFLRSPTWGRRREVKKYYPKESVRTAGPDRELYYLFIILESPHQVTTM